MRDTDKTLFAFVFVAAVTIVTMVVTIGLCNSQRWNAYEARTAASTHVVVHDVATAIE